MGSLGRLAVSLAIGFGIGLVLGDVLAGFGLSAFTWILLGLFVRPRRPRPGWKRGGDDGGDAFPFFGNSDRTDNSDNDSGGSDSGCGGGCGGGD